MKKFPCRIALLLALSAILIFPLPESARAGRSASRRVPIPEDQNYYKQSGENGNFDIFDAAGTERLVLEWQRREHAAFGKESDQKYHRSHRYKNTVIMQRSGRKRLYDHNVFLAALYSGRIVHRDAGPLGARFRKAVFIDIGSGILCDEGAPTVRDLFEDDRVWVNLSRIIATDINGPSSRFVDTYRITRRNLPFPVREIGMKLVWKRHFRSLVEGISDDSPLIIRSANSGPDLYYTTSTLVSHFQSMLKAYRDREVLYLFNKFVFYKSADSPRFQKIGEIDFTVGMSHNGNRWEDIDWKRRKLSQAFFPDSRYITIREKG